MIDFHFWFKLEHCKTGTLLTNYNCGQVNFVKLIEISIIIFAIKKQRKMFAAIYSMIASNNFIAANITYINAYNKQSKKSILTQMDILMYIFE